MLEVYKKGHNYITDIDDLYQELYNKFDKKTDEYFAAVEEMEADWNKKYEATREKCRLIVYGNKEGRKRSSRSDLYEKIVKRSEGWQNYRNLSLAFSAVSVAISVFVLLQLFFGIFPTPKCRDLSSLLYLCWFSIGFNWLPQSFLGIYSVIKYESHSREDERWLNSYFKCSISMIDAHSYLYQICEKERKCRDLISAYDKNIELLKKQNELLDKNSKLVLEISNMKKFVKSMYDANKKDAYCKEYLGTILNEWDIEV